MASDMRWNPVSVNFNDASAFMRNAGDSLSKAGTVFGELRKSILDEEQRAIENAYKEKVFDENVRQFDTRLGWDKDRFGQEQAWNREKLGKEQELAYAQLAELAKYHQASIAQQARGNDLGWARFNQENAQREKAFAINAQSNELLASETKRYQEYLKNRSSTVGKDEQELSYIRAQIQAENNRIDDPTKTNTPEQLEQRFRTLDNLYAQAQAREQKITDFDKKHQFVSDVPFDSSPADIIAWKQYRANKAGVSYDAGQDVMSALFTSQQKRLEKAADNAAELDKAMKVANINANGRAQAARASKGKTDSEWLKGMSINPADYGPDLAASKPQIKAIAKQMGVENLPDHVARDIYLQARKFGRWPFGDESTPAVGYREDWTDPAMKLRVATLLQNYYNSAN